MSGTTPTERRYGPRFDAALAFSSAAHRGQVRKGSGAPYITHPLAVTALVGQFGGDEDQAIAALLHDVVEDCGVAGAELERRFGERVARIVLACTDAFERPKPPWRERKESHVARMRIAPGEVKLVATADKLHNALSTLHDRRRKSVGEAVWDRFTADKHQTRWYYAAMCDALGHQWDHELHAELVVAVAELHED